MTREGKAAGRPKGSATDLRTKSEEGEVDQSGHVNFAGFWGRWRWPSGVGNVSQSLEVSLSHVHALVTCRPE